MKKLPYTLLLPGLIFFSLLPVSCENDMKIVNSFGQVENMPIETARDIEMLYSNYGHVQAMVSGPLMNRYAGDKPYTEFPEGIYVEFYDSLMNVKSSLKARYAISYEKSGVMEARNNVEVINFEKQEKINTEHLAWDQHQKLIFSDVFVKITTPDKVLYGEEGFESDERMERWIIKKPKGTFTVKD